MSRFPIILLTLMGALYCSAAPAQEGSHPKTHKPKIDLPVPEQAWGNPVAAVYTQGWWSKGSEIGNPDAIRPRVIVALWADGRIVWSDNSIEGGPPYREATLEPARVEELLKNLEERDVFADPGLSSRLYFGPDSTWSAIVVLHDGKYLNMQSWHELFEQRPNLVGTAQGITSLGQRSREEVLADQPEEYREFRRVWSVVKEALLALIPGEGGKPSDVSFTAERVSVEQP